MSVTQSRTGGIPIHMSTQTVSPAKAFASPAVAYIDHLVKLSQAGQAIKPSAEVVRTVLAKAGVADVIDRVLSGPGITYVHLKGDANRSAIAMLLEPLWGGREEGPDPRIQIGLDKVLIRREGWEQTRPVTVEKAQEPVLAYGKTETQLFEQADVLDSMLAAHPVGTLWDMRELTLALPRQGLGMSAATLQWMIECGFIVKIQLRGRTLFLRQHVAA